MYDSSKARKKQPPSFLQRLRRNTIIVVLFGGGLSLALLLMRPAQIPQASSDRDRQQASKIENDEGRGSSSYQAPSHDKPSPSANVPKAKRSKEPSPPAPLPSTGEGSRMPSPAASVPKGEGSAELTAGNRTPRAPRGEYVEDPVMGDLPPARPAPPVEAKKLPPPSAAAQEEAGRLMDEIYKISQAKTPKRKLEVANELFTLARSPQVKPDERFVLLRKTVDLAVEGGDMPLVLAAIHEAAGEFEFDSLAAEEKALARFAQRPMDAARTKAFFAGVTQVIEEAIAAERNEPAQELLALARQVSQRKEGKDYRPLMDRFQADIAKVSAHRGAIHSAETALASNPDDPEANRSMGAHYCLVEGDWKHGLACLAKCSDIRIRALAAQELGAPPSEAEEQLKRAGQWWELAQAERATIHDVSMLRAGFWYEQARARLAAGLMRLSAEQRLGEIAAEGELLRK